MTEKRFYLMNVEDPLHEYGRWCKSVLEDGETAKQYENALEVMDLLNDFNDENERLKKENEQLQKDCTTLICSNQEYRKENEQLKQSYTKLEHRHSLLHDECLDAECDRDSYCKDVLSLEKENEDLKKLLKAYQNSVADYKYQIRKAVDEELNMVELADNCGVDVE